MVKRDELRWELKDILAKETDFDKILNELIDGLKEYPKIKKKLSPDISEKEFKKIIDWIEVRKIKSALISTYSSLLLATNVKHQKARLFQSKFENYAVTSGDASRFLSHWIQGLPVKGLKKLDDKNAERLFKSIPDLTYGFQRSREAAKHTLSENEEKIIDRKDITGVSVLNEMYDLIVNDFKYKLKIKGKEKVIENQQELMSLAHSTDPETRKAVYQALFQPYEKNIDKFLLTYTAVAKDWKMEGELRKYASPISVRNFNNNIPDEVIDTLLKTCSKNVKVFQKYFLIKAKLLGMKKLRRYDIYAPLFEESEKIKFDEAQKIVFETFETFSPDFAAKAKSVITNKHLDSHPRKDKRNGAFCMSITPKILPYVLTNFDGKMRDVSTLAHELGHAVHDLYASNHYSSVMHAPLPLCETASTFGEMIVFEKLLRNAKTKKIKKAMLLSKIADSYATIIRQNYFIKFEIEAHEMIMKGCTEQELSDLYYSMLKEQFGSSVDLNKEFRHEWAYIPHIFHSPFYCYAYSFGELLSLALFAEYKKKGKKFIPKFEKLLSAGGSQDPVKLLKSLGVDIYSEQFWQGGFNVVSGWVKELEKEV